MKTNLKALPNDELWALSSGLEISLKYTHSRTGKRQLESFIQKVDDEKDRRNKAVIKDYHATKSVTGRGGEQKK